jgi:TATA-binding protein-associated factor
MEPLALHWHQLAGVHAIMRMNFTKNPVSSDHRCGMLIADEVGLGKTFQAATTIAFLSDLVMCQKLSQSQPVTFPPIIRKFAFGLVYRT